MSSTTIQQVKEARTRKSLGALLDEIDFEYGSPMSVISDCLRAMIVAKPGHDLIAADYANIEGRVLAWLANEKWKVDAFIAFDRGHGADIYKLAYGRAFNIPPNAVTKDQRQIGKIMELALGYGGGVGAFQTMARGYGVQVTDERADELKIAWRQAHPKIKAFWFALERAAIDAVQNPGKITIAGSIRWLKSGSFLFCRLPSGRSLCYPYAKVVQKPVPWSKEPKDALEYMCIDSLSKVWGPCTTYGGSLAENVTQAVARDVLVNGMMNVEAKGYPVIMHVHDESVSEVAHDTGSVEEYCELLCAPAPWMKGLPVTAEGWRGKRYRK